MNHRAFNLIGSVGVFSCVMVGAFHLISVLMAGPRVLPFLQTPLSVFCIHLFNGAFSVPNRAQGGVLDLYVALYLTWLVVLSVLFWRRTRDGINSDPEHSHSLLGMQVLIALCCEPSLLNIIAAELAFVLPQRKALLGLGLQICAFITLSLPVVFGVGGLIAPLDPVADGLEMLMNVAWMVAAFGVGYLAGAEKRNRVKLEIAHAELLATQHLLKDTLQASERARISRNLHDVLGHHLTSLNLHLQLGLRQSGAEATESFLLSRQLAQGLLDEVRHAVSSEREERAIDLHQALRILCSGIPMPHIQLSYPAQLQIHNPALAHTLFQCVQESITNTLKHAGASHVQVVFVEEEQNLSVVIQDDGKGAPKLEEGNGLRGMRERVRLLQGQFRIASSLSGGFALHLQFPLTGGRHDSCGAGR